MMWLQREKVSLGDAWYPHPKKASGEAGQWDTSTKQQKCSRADAGEGSTCREIPDMGRAQLPQPGAAPRASWVSRRLQGLCLYFSPKACFHSSPLLYPCSICLDCWHDTCLSSTRSCLLTTAGSAGEGMRPCRSLLPTTHFSPPFSRQTQAAHPSIWGLLGGLVSVHDMVTSDSLGMVSVTQGLPLFLMFAQTFKTEVLSNTSQVFAKVQMLAANKDAAGEHHQQVS